MDSLTQIVLGTAVADITSQGKLNNRAALRGALLGTLPDLDVFVGPLLFDNPLQQEFFHRGVTHSFLFACVAAPLIGRLLAKATQRGQATRKLRTQVAFRAMFTHIFLDLLTGYGTQIFWPFVRTPLAIDSIFIVDPLYTLPFLALLVVGLFHAPGSAQRRWWIGAGLIVSSCYLLWSLTAKWRADQTFSASLARQQIDATELHTSPEALTTFLWRGRAQDEQYRYFGRWSIFDRDDQIDRHRYPKHHDLLTPYLSESDTHLLLQRYNHHYLIEKISDDQIAFYPVQFGPVLGWGDPSDPTFLFAYQLQLSGSDIVIDEQREFRGLPDDRRPQLLDRIGGE